MVKHIIPLTLASALEYLASGNVRLMAGGTDLMLQKRSSAGTMPKFDKDVLYLANLTELQYCKMVHGELHIGAMTRLEDILNDPLTPELLKMVINEMASPGIRHMATLAGNIANASPAGDGLVALYVLDAAVVVTSSTTERRVPIAKFITGVRKTVLQPNEMITAIIIPPATLKEIKWLKVGGRQADAISKISFAGAYTFVNNRLVDLRIALGAIAPTVVRVNAIEQSLLGKTKSEITAELPMILNKYHEYIRPIDDQRSSKEYRREVADNILKDFFLKMK